MAPTDQRVSPLTREQRTVIVEALRKLPCPPVGRDAVASELAARKRDMARDLALRIECGDLL